MYNRYTENFYQEPEIISEAPREEVAETAAIHPQKTGFFNSLFKGFRFDNFKLDDILLIALILILLMEDGDNEVVLIIAIVFMLGIF